MAELLTKDDVKTALQEVLASRELLDPIVRPLVLEVTRDKFERVLGVDCMDPTARAQTRMDMEFSRKARLWHDSPDFEETKKDLGWGRRTRIYFEGEEGAQRITDARRIARIVDMASMNIGKTIVYLLIGGAAFMGGAGLIDPHWIKRLFP